MPAWPHVARAPAAALAAVLLLVPPAAGAAEAEAGPAAGAPAEEGFSLSVRAAGAAPYGDLSGEPGPALDEVVARKTPLWIEVGYRLHRRLQLALFMTFADVATESGACLTGGCEGRSVGFGAGLQLQLAPGKTFAPWIGVGVAFEFLHVDAAVDLDGDGTGDVDGEQSFAGVELPLVEAGVDLVLSSRFRVGPYVTLSPGQFTSLEVEAPGAPGGRRRIEDRAVHAWLQVGVKITFDL